MDVLRYPLDGQLIIRKKKSIRKELLEKSDFVERRIAILGGSTTDEVRNILELFFLNQKIRPLFYESDYNRYYEEAVFDYHELAEFSPDLIYVFTTNVNVSRYPTIYDTESVVEHALQEELRKYISIWNSLERFQCPVIQNNFDLPFFRTLGNFEGQDIRGRTHYLNQLNLRFASEIRKRENVHLLDLHYLSSYIGIDRWFSSTLWYQAKYAISMEYIPELCYEVVKVASAVWGMKKKCLVLDLDNTCWGGVIGDDGIEKIALGKDSPLGEGFSMFQHYIKSLKEQGVALAICSKNEIESAKEGFLHPDSVLSWDDFVSVKANWDPKHQNIKEVIRELNLGTDSFVFIDDNPVERELVSREIPEVEVPHIGLDVVDYIAHIDRNGYFETVSISGDDLNRSKFYQQNAKRVEECHSFSNYNEFLSSLGMKAELKEFHSLYLDRITQLINKTNQFNLTTKRYTYGEIEALMNDDNAITLYARLSDKFGDNGLVSVMIGRVENNVAHIELFLMSCRVLQRSLEDLMMNHFMKLCREKKIKKVIGYYLPTKKNKMVSELYDRFGFSIESQLDNQTTWEIDTSIYVENKVYIEVEHD